MRRGFAMVMGMALAVSTLAMAQTNAPVPARTASGITPPVALSDHSMTEGDYPPLARARGEEGATIVYYVVNADGNVGDTRIESSSGYADLDAAALDMVKSWRFKPATRDGKPLAVSNHTRIAWTLTGPPPDSSPYFTTVHMSAADYPPDAKARHEEGFAEIIVYLDNQGHVLKTELSRGTGFDDLDKATENLVTTRWTFAPGAFMGKPASSAVALLVIWSLEPEAKDSGKAAN
jgi:TonB family protein